MLGLAEQVGGDPLGIVAAIGDDHDLGWPCDHVDPDHAVELALGFGDPGIARAGDHIDRGNAPGAIGKCRNRLCAADAPYLVDPGDMRGGEHQRIDLALGSRCDHDEAFDACDLGRNGVHQH